MLQACEAGINYYPCDTEKRAELNSCFNNSNLKETGVKWRDFNAISTY